LDQQYEQKTRPKVQKQFSPGDLKKSFRLHQREKTALSPLFGESVRTTIARQTFLDLNKIEDWLMLRRR
jgi:hypothetical protein